MPIEIQAVAAIGSFLLLHGLIYSTCNLLLLDLPVAASNEHHIAPWTGGVIGSVMVAT